MGVDLRLMFNPPGPGVDVHEFRNVSDLPPCLSESEAEGAEEDVGLLVPAVLRPAGQ